LSNNEKGLKKPGRPVTGKYAYSGKCDVRLSRQEDAALTDLANRNGVTRSDIMRKALKDFIKFNSSEE
jgi:hypothetical protein